MGVTPIEWTDYTLNTWFGCTRISPGCENCYAESMINRFASANGHLWEGLAKDGRWTGKLKNHMAQAFENFEKKCVPGSKVFVNSMSDTFHEAVPREWLEELWAFFESHPDHTFQVLTKRPEKMYNFLHGRKPLPNVWLGVSVENQRYYDKRVPYLLGTPAIVRYLSCEPLLGPVKIGDITDWDTEYLLQYWGKEININWVIVGAESGQGARPLNHAWVRSLRDQCAAADVAFFYKQDAVYGKKISTPMLDGRQHVAFPKV